jgi:hypothetical protein
MLGAHNLADSAVPSFSITRTRIKPPMPNSSSRRLGKSEPYLIHEKNDLIYAPKYFREAYQILSDPNTRAFYDKVGKNKMNESAGGEGGMEMQDPSALFSQLFGGERFQAWLVNLAVLSLLTKFG